MSTEKRHTFVFRGTVEVNPHLQPDATQFINAKGGISPIRQPTVDGLVFGFMEAPEGITITQVDDIALTKRILVNSRRHLEGGGLAPNGHDVGEQAARNALADVITANPGLAAPLDLKKEKIHQGPRASMRQRPN